MLFDEGFDIGFAAGTDHSIDFFSTFEDDKSGDAHNVVLGGKFLVLVDIDFKDFGFSGHFGCNFFDGWGDCDAWSAPRCPKIDEDGLI